MTVSCLQSVEAASASSLMVESDVLVPLRSREDSQWVMIVVIKQQNMILPIQQFSYKNIPNLA